jgi:ATP-dependent helicase/nuclease subunit A
MAAWTDSQRNAVFNTDRSLIVTAGAGSGKTRVLVGRYVHLVESHMADLDEIVAITFTEKAATEMKARVWSEMAARERAARGNPGEAARWRELSRRLSSQARISTIDSFCARLVRENPIEAGVDPQFAVVDPADAAALRRQACLKCLDQMVASKDSVIASLVAEFGVRAVAEGIEGAYERMRTTGRTAESFARLTEQMAASITGADDTPPDAPTNHVTAAKAVARACEKLHEIHRQLKGNGAMLDFSDIELAARDLLRSSKAGARIRAGIKFVMVDEYQDTNELQHEIVTLLAGDPPANRTFIVGDVKQSIYGFRGAQVDVFRHTMDNAQRCCDTWCVENLGKNFRSVRPLVELTNAVFAPALRDGLWTSDAEAARDAHPGMAHHAELHVITHLRGNTADAGKAEAQLVAERIAHMVGCKEQLISVDGGSGGTVESRAPRYRDIAILLRKSTHIKLFEAALREAGVPYYVVAGKGFHDRPEILTLMCMMRAVGDSRDALSLAATLRHPVFGLSDVTLLRLVRAGGDLCSGFVNADIDACVDPGDTYGETERLTWARQCIGRLRAMAGRLGPAQMLRAILDETGFEAYAAAGDGGRQAVGNIEKLLRMADERGRAAKGLLEFVASLEQAGADNVREPEAAMAAEDADVVTIMTVHKSKGLEYPIVFVPQLSRRADSAARGSVILVSDRLGIAVKPSSDSDMDSTAYGAAVKEDIERAEREESMRTLYVAATRASDYLVLTTSLQVRAEGDTSLSLAKEWLLPFTKVLTPCMVDQPPQRGERPEGCRVAMCTVGRGAAAFVLVTVTPVGADVSSEGACADLLTSPPHCVELPQSTEPVFQAEPPVLVMPVRTASAVRQISVSALMCLARCPRWYVYEYSLGLARVGRSVAPTALRGPVEWLNASQRGQVVHAVCQKARTSEEAAEVLNSELGAYGVTEAARLELVAKLSPMIDKFLESPEARLEGVWEQPFLLNVGETVVSGVMDLVIPGAGGHVTIVDLKTNTIEKHEVKSAAEDYRVQMQAYALAAHRAMGAGRVSAVLHFLYPAERVPAEFGAGDFAAIEEGMVKLARQAAEYTLESTSPVESHHCRTCHYSQLCWSGGGRRCDGVVEHGGDAECDAPEADVGVGDDHDLSF